MQPIPDLPDRITPELLRDPLYVLSISCVPCGVVRDFNPGPLLKAGRGGEDLERRFVDGKMRCRQCGQGSRWMRLARVTPSSKQETELLIWRRR